MIELNKYKKIEPNINQSGQKPSKPNTNQAKLILVDFG